MHQLTLLSRTLRYLNSNTNGISNNGWHNKGSAIQHFVLRLDLAVTPGVNGKPLFLFPDIIQARQTKLTAILTANTTNTIKNSCTIIEQKCTLQPLDRPKEALQKQIKNTPSLSSTLLTHSLIKANRNYKSHDTS